MSTGPDLIVIGAGAAGLTAATALAHAGLSVTILEARDRIGGRIFTRRDPKYSAPVELGAEFIHGLPPETLTLLNQRQVRIRELDGDNWCFVDGKLGSCNFFSEAESILSKMDDRKPDQSFLDFLEECCPRANASARQQHSGEWVLGYVSGFNAADPALVGVHWLVQGMRAEEEIEGDRAFRAEHGYADLVDFFQEQLDAAGVSVLQNTIVEEIRWSPGRAEINLLAPEGASVISAPRVLITVPLGVLQAQSGAKGAIRFAPDLPQQKQNAIRNVIMGKASRVVLRFRERFWKDLPSGNNSSKKMDGMSFLFSHDKSFPTWWTTSPEKLPFLVGWAPFRAAEALAGKEKSFVAEQSLNTLHRLLGVSVPELEGLLEHAYVHDWQSDPFSRGAYSYGRVGGDGMNEALARPIDNTLFFAGEATDVSGHNGTVHGAIASGNRAAAEILPAAATGTLKLKTGD
jgi:monoamine oxidase